MKYRRTYSFDPQTWVWIRHMAKEYGTTGSNLVRHLVREGLESRGAPPPPSVEECRWLIKHLGENNRKRKDEYVGQHFTF